jgi:hypothetical protein
MCTFSRFFILSLLLLGIDAFAQSAQTNQPPDGLATLDQNRIREAYANGDFEPVKQLMSSFTSSGHRFSREDSLFAFKYLAVVHSADPMTLEKGKYYMNQLLEISPEARAVQVHDTFAKLAPSPAIYAALEGVRIEFNARNGSQPIETASTSIITTPSTLSQPMAEPTATSTPMQNPVTAAKTEKSPVPVPQKHSELSRKGISPWVWAGGAVGVVAVGVVAFTQFSSEPDNPSPPKPSQWDVQVEIPQE